MKVTANKDVFFPKLKWGISKGEVKELPDEKSAQDIILSHNAIRPVSKSNQPKEDAPKTAFKN